MYGPQCLFLDEGIHKLSHGHVCFLFFFSYFINYCGLQMRESDDNDN